MTSQSKPRSIRCLWQNGVITTGLENAIPITTRETKSIESTLEIRHIPNIKDYLQVVCVKR